MTSYISPDSHGMLLAISAQIALRIPLAPADVFLFVVSWHQSGKKRDTLNDTLIITHIFRGCPTAVAVSFHQARPWVLIKTFRRSPERGTDVSTVH